MKKVISDGGRIVVPKHMYEQLGVSVGDEVEIEIHGNMIQITNPKYEGVKSELLTNLKLLNNKYHDSMLSSAIDMIERL